MTPLSEYPRPQLARSSYFCLNGQWDLTFDDGKKYAITVPYSPETRLSGVGRTLKPGESMEYRRHVAFPEPIDFSKERLFVHFGAADYMAQVYEDGRRVASHRGGYLPFKAEVSKAEFDLSVVITDPSDSCEIARGKQVLQPGGIWYPAQSGLWQTVWMEKVPRDYIERLVVTPALNGFGIIVVSDRVKNRPCTLEIGGKVHSFRTEDPYFVRIENPRLWSPEDPYLYEFKVTCGEDSVCSYTGLRTFGLGDDGKGHKALLLNGKPYYHHGLLDQGYYMDGLYTPHSDEEMAGDIVRMKAMGFNTLRKHIKVEPLRWYYHCDRLGMLVWQDMVCGGGHVENVKGMYERQVMPVMDDGDFALFNRTDREERDWWEMEAGQMVNHLISETCIAMWVPFNEGWGQFSSSRILKYFRGMDATRTIDINSGFQDQGDGDFHSTHIYHDYGRIFDDPVKPGRCEILSEYGGYGLDMNTTALDKYDYHSCDSIEDLTRQIVELIDNVIIPARKAGLAASIYTQVSDVEQEINGLLSYDRKTVKVLEKDILAASRRLLG